MQRHFDIDCELNYDVYSPSTIVFKIEAAFASEQYLLHETLTTLPVVPMHQFTDGYGTRSIRVNVQPGPFSIRYQARAIVDRLAGDESMQEVGIGQLPLDTLQFLTGSRYIESELIFHEALNWIGAGDRGFRRVQRICQWVRNNINYQIGTSQPHGTTRDVLSARTGVCRDYAHVAIALCRALGIPARFVVGHVHWNDPPPDFHALFEAWLDSGWVVFDPTQMADPLDVVRIGTGSDASAVPFATIFGSASMTRMSTLVFRS